MSQETAVKDHDEQPWGFVGRISHLAHNELVGGGVLLLATVIAIVLANTPASHEVEGLLGSELGFGLGALDLRHSVHAWVNDALMALFFFVVGLEIKQELTTGDLRTPQKAALPVVAALGGMIVPAAIFLLWNGGTETSVGWGVPMATDIAFALAVLGVVGRGLPSGLRTFLLALAIADDLGAILVIAVFYTETIDTTWLTVAVLGLGLVVMMRRAGVNLVSAYVPVGVLVWYATLESGIHATIAGVAIGLLTPALVAHGERSWARVLQQRLHP
ncbi:MAG: Na+/H+ antiporter NhaA, partial [Acidimicrobiales bacterium]